MASKQVFCEKPLALDLDGPDEVVNASKSASGHLTIGFDRRFAPMVVAAHDAGGVGPIVMVYRVNAGAIAADSWIQRGEGGVPKEYLEAFGAGRVVQISDFTRLDITVGGKMKTTKSKQNKRQGALIASFLETVPYGGAAPIPPADLVAVAETKFAIEKALCTGAPVILED